MQTNYKFWFITRDDDVHISRCGVYFGEGEDVTEDVYVAKEDAIISLTRYKRSKILDEDDLVHLEGREKLKDAFIYTDADFGVITTDDELRDYLDDELSKDKTRDPIPKQDKKIRNKTKR